MRIPSWLRIVVMTTAILALSVTAHARWDRPWGLGVNVSSGYTASTPFNSQSKGALLGGGLELRYTTDLGVGANVELGLGTAFMGQDTNPFNTSSDLLFLPLSVGFVYEYPARNFRPFATLSMGYTYWKLDRTDISNNDSRHRINMTLRGGFAYRVWDSIFISAAAYVTMPNMLSGSEELCIWPGVQIGAMWRF